MKHLAVSILSADFSNLAEDVKAVETAGADLLHIDVMDGHFVPNITFGSLVVKSLAGKTKLPFDIHLMVDNPDRFIDDFITTNTVFIVVHQEACVHLNRTLNHIKDKGLRAGVAINPSTPVSQLKDVLGLCDQVLIMSVNPGFAAQEFISNSYDKVRELADIRRDKNYGFLISVDGGVNLDNAEDLFSAGADILVAGSAIYSSKDPSEWVRKFTARYKS